MKNKTIGCYLSLAGAVLALAALIVYFLNGAGNTLVIVCTVLAVACGGVYFAVSHPAAEVCSILGVVFVAISLFRYIVDSIPTLLDYFNGISMFQSGGGITTVVTLSALMGVSALAFILSSFMKHSKA